MAEEPNDMHALLPPPYGSEAPQLPTSFSLTSVTTQTETVTRTTTITTLLPNFKKLLPTSKSSTISNSATTSDQANPLQPSHAVQSKSFQVNKALPKPPSLDPYDLQSRPLAGSELVDGQLQPPSLVENNQTASIQRKASYSTLSLAQASLGVGATPLIPAQIKPSFLASSVNSHSGTSTRSPRVRRVTLGLDEAVESVDSGRRSDSSSRRQRVLSMGPLDLLSNFTSDDSSNARTSIREPMEKTLIKGRDIDKGPSRRPSFWRLRIPSLPTLSQPISPPPIPLRSPLRLAPERPKAPTSPNNSAQDDSSIPQSSSFADLPSLQRSPKTLLRRAYSARASSSHSNDHHEARLFDTEDGLQSRSRLSRRPNKESEASIALSSHGLAPSATINGALLSESPIERDSVLLSSMLDDSNANSRIGSESNQDTSQRYLNELLSSISKSEIATLLASSGDEQHARALRHYMERFSFHGDAIDIALRKLLMELGLPKETQQIDRVVEAFSQRYASCNPDLFASEDQPYVLAFSLIMLHTDAFNKSNKHKMSKTDYVKNTRLPGIAKETLEYLYDNIVFTPFIFVEDPMDVNGQPDFLADPKWSSDTRASTIDRTNSSWSKTPKVDPYYLIATNLLASFRIVVDEHIPPFNPYLYDGTLGTWDEEELRKAFDLAPFIEVGEKRSNLDSPLPVNGLAVGGAASLTTGVPIGSVDTSKLEAAVETGNLWSLKVTKVGVLDRKDDVLEKGKRSTARKWKSWSVILTGSQILFFQGTSLAEGLSSQANSGNHQSLFPHTAFLRPDDLLSVNDSIAVYDKLYHKHANTLRLVMPSGRQILLRAPDEESMNQWMALINYASTFKTSGIRMRSLSSRHVNSNEKHADYFPTFDFRTPFEVNSSPTLHSDESVDACSSPTMEALSMPFPSSRPRTQYGLSSGSPPPTPTSQVSGGSVWRDDMSNVFIHSRMMIIRAKLQELETKITSLDSQLVADLRIARNFSLLTPFQKSMRDRLKSAVTELSKRVHCLRLELVKFQCHHRVLNTELRSAELLSKSRSNLDSPRSFGGMISAGEIPRKLRKSNPVENGSSVGDSETYSHRVFDEAKSGRTESVVTESPTSRALRQQDDDILLASQMHDLLVDNESNGQ